MSTYQYPKRAFEEAGLVDPKTSYYVKLDHVVSTRNQDIYTMIDQGRYFSIFAPRQSGKTTFFEEVCRELARKPQYIPVILNFQDYKSLDIPTFYALIQKELYTQIFQRLPVVVFDLKTPVGKPIEPQRTTLHGKDIVSIGIGIGDV